MRVSFGVRLGLAISLLSVGITASSVTYFYSTTSQLVLRQMTGRLKDIGRASVHLFDFEARDRIEQLTAQVEAAAQISPEELESMVPGDILETLSLEQAEFYQNSAIGVEIIQTLRRINHFTRQEVPDLDAVYPQEMVGVGTENPLLITSYLLVPTEISPDRTILMFIGSDMPDPMEEFDWPRNPIGQLYYTPVDVFSNAFDGQVHSTEDFYVDSFYTSLTAAVPLTNREGEVIAILGLDYIAGSEADRIRDLRYTCLGIILTSAVLSVLMAIVLARWLGYPISQLQAGAQRVRDRKFDEPVPVSGQDELGLLATTFNSMTAEIRDYAIALENQNDILEQRVADRTDELAQEQEKLRQANQQIQTLNHKLKAENLRMSAELDIARQVQQMILPSDEEIQQVLDLDIAAFSNPAAEVGGDYYDVLMQDGQLKIGIGDVSGHGLESGVVMIMAQTAVQTLQSLNETDPVKVLNTLNRVLHKNINRMGSQKFMTLVLLDYETGRLKLTGQHEEVIVIRLDGTIESIDTFDLGFPLGLEFDITSYVSQAEVYLQQGEVAVLYTDGITEAFNEKDELYGLERFHAVLRQNRDRSADEIRKAVIEDVKHHVQNQKIFDDITLIVLKQR